MPAWLTHGLGPWLLAALGLAFIVAIIATIRAIRESRFSPYYLLRRQASERMHTRIRLSLALLIAWIALAVILSQRPPIEIRIQLPALPFVNPAQPPSSTATATPSPVPPTAVQTATGTPTLVPPPTRQVLPSIPPLTPTRALPISLLTPLTPAVTARPDATFGPITIAAGVITTSVVPTVITDTFRTGQIRVYAVFTYTQMTPGTVWTYVWLRDDTAVNAAMERWAYTRYGRAYISLRLPGGLRPGDYRVDLFIEERFQQSAAFRVLP